MDLRVSRVPLDVPVTMVFPESLDFLDLPAPLDPLVLVDTTCPSCLMEVRNPAEYLLVLDHQAQWDPVDLLDLQVLLVLKDSLALQVNLASLALLVPWVLVVPLVLLERTEMMVRLANLVAPVSVELLVLREVVVSLEPLDFPASRDTEVSLV